ncbi:Ig-like domain-containing protein, partial [Idiomarina aminovorans]|uniref:Ig-like domain-containing protein n=1 Tax=Idiomarina aminovorans TaxID=2914829 RepID=UPI002002AEC3
EYNTVVNADGTWSVDVAGSDLAADTEFDVVVNSSDEAGNTVNSTAASTHTVDQMAPGAPGISLDNDTGLDDSDGVTSDGSYSVGDVEAGATVEYSTDGGETWMSEAPEAVEGENIIQVRQTDEAGNVSDESELTFTLDTNVVAPSISLDNDTGSDDSDGVTSDGSYSVGDVEAGATVEYSTDGGEIWMRDAPEAVEGENTIRVRQTDEAGNVSDESELTFTLDTSAPTLTIDAPDTNDTTPTLSGTSDEIGATISVTVTDANNETQTLTAVVAADGSWAVDVADELAEGTYTVQASVEDDAGNEAVANTQGEIDLTAPTLTLEVPTNVNDTTPTISGTSDEIGGTVYLVVTDADGNEQQLEATVDNNGNWQVDTEIPLAVGEYTVSATISDDVGNQAQASQSEGTIEPSVTIVDFELNSEVDVNVTDSIWDGGVSNNQFGIISNYSVNENNPGDIVESYRINDRWTRNLEITSKDGSNETYLFAVGDTYTVSYLTLTRRGWQTVELEMTVTRSDVQGFNGEDTDILVLTGTLPSGEDVTLVMASGEIDNFYSFYVNDKFDTDVGFREFTVNGEAASNSTVIIEQVDENGNVIDSATVTSDANGQWSYDVGQLEGRSGILKVTSTDQYGNESVDEKNFLFGETNNENTLEGSGSSDLIVGGLEDDSITGGQDSDVLIGGGGNDTFVWKADDEGTVNIPEADTIQDFALGNFASDEEADRLDLSDLLQGESTGSIDNYLYAEDDGNGNTVLHINSEGNLSGSDNADQVVTLQDAQMADGQSSSDFIQQMLNDGQLLIDSGSSASTQSSSEGTSIDLHQTNKLSGLE